MQNAATLLRVIHTRGQQGLPLQRVYRHLFNRELFLLAYGRIYRNAGSMTPGATEETVDGMSLAKIDRIIDALRTERFRWTPVRRITIPKPRSTKRRPLGLPTWTDKLVQEVIRLLLDAYYDPQFSHRVHGFRAGRGCHSALAEIRDHWTGTVWFIEGDIAQCFDSLDHEILIAILREDIQDERFLRLIRRLLQAGYLQKWTYHQTYSGTPQGGVLSPLLANIYLDQLDRFVETTLIPQYTQGHERAYNPAYARVSGRLGYLEKTARGGTDEAVRLRKLRRTLPAGDLWDPGFRRLRYVRYADDFLLGFIGSHQEAEQIKAALQDYLHTSLKLTLSPEKTLITHARTESARFLGYDLHLMLDNDKLDERGRRFINGKIGLRVPTTVATTFTKPYMRNGKPVHRGRLMENSVYSIVAHYQQEFRGLVEFYRRAYNLSTVLNRVEGVLEQSLVKTLARKLRISVPQVYRRYESTYREGKRTYKVLEVTVERPEKPPLVTRWGGISLSWDPDALITDTREPIWNDCRAELIERLLADTCELCGYAGRCEVHHVRALKDLTPKGRQKRPKWMRIMAARRRKTLIVCHDCHWMIHRGAKDTPHDEH
ncbi:MAG TPA: reverse transcriptase domain-containing protein [Herpetosiphonaceae bacterium]|nr:reverse transcriptase domain-containing protein [Herpetosiphonaceae bacterium]